METRRAVAATLFVVFTAGCMGSPKVIRDPVEYIPAEAPKQITLTQLDGRRLVVDAPQVFGDTLLGWTRTPAGPEEVWLGLNDIRRVEVRQRDPVRTGLAFAGSAAVIAGLIYLATKAGGSGGVELSDEPIDDSSIVPAFRIQLR